MASILINFGLSNTGITFPSQEWSFVPPIGAGVKIDGVTYEVEDQIWTTDQYYKEGVKVQAVDLLLVEIDHFGRRIERSPH